MKVHQYDFYDGSIQLWFDKVWYACEVNKTGGLKVGETLNHADKEVLLILIGYQLGEQNGYETGHKAGYRKGEKDGMSRYTSPDMTGK